MKKGEKTKNRILDTAKELFSEKGYNAVTMTAVKENAGLSIGAVYKYFSSIKDIYLAILARDEATAKAHTQNTDSMTGEEILAYALERNYKLAGKQQLGWVVAMYEFMLCEDDYKDTMKERLDSCINFNKAMVALGVSGCGDEELRQRALLLFNYMNGFQLTAATYLFTKEDMMWQLKLLRRLLFEKGRMCMKEYLCEKISDSKENIVKETIGAIAIGALGAMTDSKAEKYKITVDEEDNTLSVIGIGHSAWGGVEEIKENEKEYFKLSEVSYHIEDGVITLENKKRVRKFRIKE